MVIETSNIMKKQLSKMPRFALYFLVLSLLALVIWTLWGNTALMVSKIIISSEKIPLGFSGFKIAQVSDLHNAEFGEGNARLLQTISETTPDIIVITGDLVDSRNTDIDIALNFVKEAVQISPVYYVTGNHEAALARYSELKKGLESAGVVVIDDAAVHLEKNGDIITLIGLSDPNFTTRSGILDDVPSMVTAKLNSLLDDAPTYTILLSHRPELFDTYVSCGIDLVFSGHAHGGQFRFPLVGGLIAPHQGLFPKYDAGLYTKGETNTVVSRGIGNSIIPLRFNNRPEVVLVEFERKS